MEKIFFKYFIKNGNVFCKNLSIIIPAILRCGKANTSLIAKEMSVVNGKSFKTNDIHLFRFLQSDNFKINNSLWRQNIKMIFSLMKENNLIQPNDIISINLNFTLSEKKILVLSASVNISGKFVVIYFSSKPYCQLKYKSYQIKMELRFIKTIRQILSKNYRYVIVADRNFVNKRFINLCRDNAFEYILRVKPNLEIRIADRKNENLINFSNQNLKNLNCFVESWKSNAIFDIYGDLSKNLFLLKSSNQLDAVSIYENRLKSEDFFQDSQGFEIEKTKIEKHDRFNRLLYCINLARFIAAISQNIINKKDSFVKESLVSEKIASEIANLNLRTCS